MAKVCAILLSLLLKTSILANGATVMAVDTMYDSNSIADFQIRGTLSSMHERLNYNAPPITTYDFSDYSITAQLDAGIRALEFDILPCDGHTGDCTDFIMTDISYFDQGATCDTLSACLNEVGAWSNARKGYHVPIFIKIEAENSFIPGRWDSLDAWDTLASVVETSITSQYSSGDDDSPIFSYYSFVNDYGDSWENVTLADARGKIFFYLTPSNTEYVRALVDAENDEDIVFNEWYTGVSDVLFSSCNKGNREETHCEFVQNKNGGKIDDLHSDRNYSHIFTSNIDDKLVQIENYAFDDSAGTVTYLEDGETVATVMNISDWELMSWYYNIKLSPNTYDNGCSLTEVVLETISDTDSDGNDADDGFNICQLYDFISYHEEETDTADGTIAELESQNVTSIANYEEFISIIYSQYSSLFDSISGSNDYDPTSSEERRDGLLDSNANLLLTGYPFGTDIYGGTTSDSYSVTLDTGCDTNYPTTADSSSSNAVLKLGTVCLYVTEVEYDEGGSSASGDDSDNGMDSGARRVYGQFGQFGQFAIVFSEFIAIFGVFWVTYW